MNTCFSTKSSPWCSAIWLIITLALPTRAAPQQTPANVPAEIQFQAQLDHLDPFNHVTLDAVFTDPAGHDWRVPAFWAGGKTWKVRYASPLPGQHRFRTECSVAADQGLHGVSGSIEIKPYAGDNPLFQHGPLRVAPDRRHLQHADGTPFFWLGDTWWMGLCHRLKWPDEFKTLAADRRAKGFSVIQIVAGLYPDMGSFDPRGANEAGFPWETNYARIRPAYFDAADQRLGHLVDSGLTPCIVGAWGYFLPWMGVDKAEKHWRYLIARYGAWPVVWCVAGEANLPYYLTKGFPFHDAGQVEGWTQVMRYVRETDPFHRLVTIHPTGLGRLSARNATEDVSLLDIDMLQTPHGQREAIPPTIRTVRESYADQPVMPVINGEASYEMLMDTIPADWPRAMFWICMLNGAAGHTYGANGIWQCNRRDQPHGASPHGGNYGRIPWDAAMDLPGSRQVALGRKLFEQYDWQQFTPHPEWAVCATNPALKLDGCQWIWFPEGDPARDAPVAKRYFQRSFAVPLGQVVAGARLFIAADDWCEVWLNGEKLGSVGSWKTGQHYDLPARLLTPGPNALAVVAENKPANVPANPAGLIACLQVRFADGQSLRLISDATWRAAKSETNGWRDSAYDAVTWPQAKVIGRYGDGPWGLIGGPSETDEPHAAGIPGRVRIIWAPRCRPIQVRNLGSGTIWTAVHFDPATGERKNLGEARADAAGQWQCEPPAGPDRDWVLILEMKSQLPRSKQET
jgi:hypothetical protein